MKEIVEHQQSKMYGFFHFLYKRKKLTFTIIKPKWRLYQATEVVPSCVTSGTCIANILPGRPISGGSVLNGQVQEAEDALALHFRMKIQFLGSHTITLPVIQCKHQVLKSQKCHERPDNQYQRQFGSQSRS
jgi:hypothetical protein